MKVYQIADELGMDADAVVARIRAFGIPVNNKMSKIEADVAAQIKSTLLKDKQHDWVEIDLGNGVRKRVRKPGAAPPAAAATPAATPAAAGAPAAAATPARASDVATPAPTSSSDRAPTEHRAPSEHRAAPEPARSAPAATPSEHTEPAPAATPAPSSAAQPAAARPAPAASASSVEHEAPASAPSTTAHAPTPAAHAPAVEREATPSATATQPTAPVAEARAATPPPSSAPTRVESAPSEPVATPRPEDVAVARTHEAPVESHAAPPATETVTSPVAPPVAAAPEAARGMPSTPPPPKTGTSVWDPATKTVTHIAPNRPVQRREMVDPARFAAQGRPGMRPGPGGRPGGPVGRPRPGLRPLPGSRPSVPSAAPMGAHKRVVKIEGQIGLQVLASRMSVKGTDVMFKLIGMGMPVNINSTLDVDTAKIVAQEFGYEVSDVAVADDAALKAILPDFKEKDEDLVTRAPVVTVMGHVDHGKTTLLDAILGMRVAEGEAGGITQKVSAYRVETKKGPVVFFDTPGHEAFTKLRARGAETTDVAVLVVAADDGVMPTTIEALNHIKAAGVPIIVALNKMDKPDAKPDRVIQQLMAHEIVPEEFGGETLVVRVSAKAKTGIEELLESLALQAEVLELKANPKRPGMGTVFDATLDKGRGVVTRALIQDGTIHTGDVVISGTAFGKIRAMFDDRGKPIAKAGPSTPVEILGLSEVPASGDQIHVVADIKKAMAFAEERRVKAVPSRPGSAAVFQSPEDIQRILAAGETITVGVIIKADAQASIEGLTKALTALSTDKVKITVVHSGIGGINENDVNLAVASKLLIIGFNVRPQGKATQLAESEKVQIRLYDVIYEAVDDVKALMVGQLKPTLIEKPLGKAEVRQVFNITKVGTIAGCMVTDGKIVRTARGRLMRDSVQVWEGKIASLRRIKEDVREVANGFECGIGLEHYNDMKMGDIIEAFEMEEVAAKL